MHIIALPGIITPLYWEISTHNKAQFVHFVATLSTLRKKKMIVLNAFGPSAFLQLLIKQNFIFL